VINAELDLSDVSADEADGDGSNPKGFEPALHYTLIITMRKIELVCLIISDFIIHFCILSLCSLQSTIMDTCKIESISASEPQDTIH
jgi:hypothetical protein